MTEKKGKVNREGVVSTEEAALIKAALRAKNPPMRYRQVAAYADRSWYMIWAVLNQRKVSAHIARILRKVSGVNYPDGRRAR